MKMRKLSHVQKDALQRVVVTLRYGRSDHDASSRPRRSYAGIARALGISYNQVQHLCRYRYKVPKMRSRSLQSRILDQEHVDFLTGQETLTLWAGYTLKERTILFHRRFPHKVIAATSLRRLYLKHGVRIKKVRQEKVMTLSAWGAFEEKRK